MRKYIDIVENSQDNSASRKIESLIKNTGFGANDIDDATCGFCGTFALALHRHLRKHGINTELVAFYGHPWSDDKQEPEDLWSHFALKHGGDFFDIRGKVQEDDIHREFDTHAYKIVTEPELVKMVRSANLANRGGHYNFGPAQPSAHSGIKYREWKGRLGPVTESITPYSEMSQQELIDLVNTEDDNSDGSITSEGAYWVYDPSFPVSKLINAGGLNGIDDWKEWFSNELDMDRDENLGRNWGTLSREEIQEPVILVKTPTGEIQIWNGYHRVAGSIVRGSKTIPAIYGVPK